WNPLVDQFYKRLSKWKSKTLSFGGRLTLLQSVLGSLGVYYFSTFKAPKKIISKFEAMGLVHPPEIAELSDMVSLLSQLHLSDIPDSWTCIIDNSRMFLVKNMCSLITHMSTSLVDQPIRWNKWLPSKVNILTWRISNKRLLTRVNIDRRGIDIDSIRCPICNGDFKSEDYLFVSYVIAIEIWKNILDW
ncbi:RNA-directed DNA polymerase, eukaryota, reverse transcriptase zinc-binding domain protein, partial [Tanacetum coccineum]